MPTIFLKQNQQYALLRLRGKPLGNAYGWESIEVLGKCDPQPGFDMNTDVAPDNERRKMNLSRAGYTCLTFRLLGLIVKAG